MLTTVYIGLGRMPGCSLSPLLNIALEVQASECQREKEKREGRERERKGRKKKKRENRKEKRRKERERLGIYFRKEEKHCICSQVT